MGLLLILFSSNVSLRFKNCNFMSIEACTLPLSSTAGYGWRKVFYIYNYYNEWLMIMKGHTAHLRAIYTSIWMERSIINSCSSLQSVREYTASSPAGRSLSTLWNR